MELVQHSSSSIGSCFGRNLIFSTVAQTLWSRSTIMVKYFSHFSTVGQRVPGGGGCVAGLVWLVYGVAGVWPVWCGWCVASIVWLVCGQKTARNIFSAATIARSPALNSPDATSREISILAFLDHPAWKQSWTKKLSLNGRHEHNTERFLDACNKPTKGEVNVTRLDLQYVYDHLQRTKARGWVVGICKIFSSVFPRSGLNLQ